MRSVATGDWRDAAHGDPFDADTNHLHAVGTSLAEDHGPWEPWPWEVITLVGNAEWE